MSHTNHRLSWLSTRAQPGIHSARATWAHSARARLERYSQGEEPVTRHLAPCSVTRVPARREQPRRRYQLPPVDDESIKMYTVWAQQGPPLPARPVRHNDGGRSPTCPQKPQQSPNEPKGRVAPVVVQKPIGLCKGVYATSTRAPLLRVEQLTQLVKVRGEPVYGMKTP